MASSQHLRQSRPDSGPGLQAQVVEPYKVFPLRSEVEGARARHIEESQGQIMVRAPSSAEGAAAPSPHTASSHSLSLSLSLFTLTLTHSLYVSLSRALSLSPISLTHTGRAIPVRVAAVRERATAARTGESQQPNGQVHRGREGRRRRGVGGLAGRILAPTRFRQRKSLHIPSY